MKRFILVSLLSCIVVGQLSCDQKDNLWALGKGALLGAVGVACVAGVAESLGFDAQPLFNIFQIGTVVKVAHTGVIEKNDVLPAEKNQLICRDLGMVIGFSTLIAIISSVKNGRWQHGMPTLSDIKGVINYERWFAENKVPSALQQDQGHLLARMQAMKQSQD